MPKIKVNLKQQQALLQIEQDLNMIREIDAALSSSEITISYPSVKGKSAFISLDEVDFKSIIVTLSKKRSRLVKSVSTNAGKYDIELSEDEYRLLNQPELDTTLSEVVEDANS